jgi:hypothetical protein
MLCIFEAETKANTLSFKKQIKIRDVVAATNE